MGRRKTATWITVLTLMAFNLVTVSLAVTGTGFYVVSLTGDSMEPSSYGGDISLCIESENYERGDVISYGGENYDYRIHHRVVQTFDNGSVIAKGDNNDYVDPHIVPRNAITCKDIITLPTHLINGADL